MEIEATILLTVGGGFIFSLVAYMWLTKTVKVIETEASKSNTLVVESTKEKIAQMQLEGEKLKINSINQKNIYDYENNKDKLKVELEKQETLLQREKLIQEAKTSRTSIKSETLLSLSKYDNETQKAGIEAGLLINERCLEFQDGQLTSLTSLETLKVNKDLEKTHLKLEGRKFEMKAGLEALDISESNQNKRLKMSIKSSMKMHKEDLETNRDIQIQRLEVDERKSMMVLNAQREREREKTTRQRIRGETEIIKGILQTANPAALVTTATRGGPAARQIRGALGNMLGNAFSASDNSRCVVECAD